MNKKLLTFAAITSMALASTAILHADNTSAKMDTAEHAQQDAAQFAGLNLTPEQSLQIAAIDESYQPRFSILQEQISALKEQYKALDPSSADYAQQYLLLTRQYCRHIQKYQLEPQSLNPDHFFLSNFVHCRRHHV